MKNTIRDLLEIKTNVVNIDQHWPTLRQKQYYNAMCELKQELEVLAGLPNIAESLKTKSEPLFRKGCGACEQTIEKNKLMLTAGGGFR